MITYMNDMLQFSDNGREMTSISELYSMPRRHLVSSLYWANKVYKIKRHLTMT